MILAVMSAIYAVAYTVIEAWKSQDFHRVQYMKYFNIIITSHSFLMGLLELTNDQLPTSVAS